MISSAPDELLRPSEARALALFDLGLPSVQELVPSSAPFEPSLLPQAPLAPSGSLLEPDGDWFERPRRPPNDPAGSSTSRDERSWDQARQAFNAVGPAGSPGPSSVRSRAPSNSSAFDLQDLQTTLPTFAHHLPPRNSPTPPFAFDPWASTSAPPPEPRGAYSFADRSAFPSSTSAPPIHRPQTYPPARPILPQQDHRRTDPLPSAHDPRHPSHYARQTNFPFVASPPPYPEHPSRLSQPSSSKNGWRAHSNAPVPGSGYQRFPSNGARYGEVHGGQAGGPPGVSYSRTTNSAVADFGRFPAPPPPRPRQQSFESSLAPRPSFSNSFRSLPYFPPVPAPLSDRRPFPSPTPSVSTSPASQIQEAAMTGAPTPKLRSGLPERSTWAMWVGNVPADATESELWVFFNQRAPLPNREAPLNGVTGVESIHLIARSNCAFINFVSSAHLQHAIAESNGIPLRPNERRCKPLVCRVRMREDDAKSGVGAQRGGGLHKAYIKSIPTKEGALSPSLKRSPSQASSEGSTTSDFFAEHFPRRYFILKAHSVYDIEESIRTGLWSTQGHNEAVLDQAYRTSEEVFLVFSANKSGAWAGYARMAGPIEIPNKKRSTSSLPAGASPVADSPTAQQLPSGLPMRADSASPISPLAVSLSPVDSMSTNSSGSTLQRPSPARAESGGLPFLVEWIKTEPIPFIKTRSIINSFNSGREVKISRDGTEVEPMAGEQLLQEFWTEPSATPSPVSSAFVAGRPLSSAGKSR